MEGLAPKPQFSPVALIALLLALTTPSSLVCCAGLFTGALGFILGGVAIYQYKTESADKTSAMMGGAAMAISGVFFLIYALAMAGVIANSMMESGAFQQ